MPGCTDALCRPAWVKIENAWYGYEVKIENEEFSLL